MQHCSGMIQMDAEASDVLKHEGSTACKTTGECLASTTGEQLHKNRIDTNLSLDPVQEV